MTDLSMGQLQLRSPYPGLRPFLDSEASIFFGRDSQVSEVIDRLRKTHFVAVIGGSGSGKSSLIRAGVIPQLRGYGIHEAGDFWIPIVVTPGTNLAQSEIPEAERESPIDRLAGKFVARLHAKSDEERQALKAQAVGLLRGLNGFSGLVNAFASRLDLPPGPDPGNANFILVLDQFEELFHSSNKDVADCAVLVERVINHFDSPHPRMYVVLTMRSEHLNDCAAYLRLPDAINEASYLVRRVDPAETDEAIAKPAPRFLRMLARSSRSSEQLPPKVEFEEPVLDRLRQDVEALHDDPDHLPLLQHLLARLWEAALDRARKEGMELPSALTMQDLERAVAGKVDGDAPAIDGATNVLRACLQNWAQGIYEKLADADRARFDAVIRRMAYKDPNTGLYTQQRLKIADAVALLGPGQTEKDLRKLLGGFLAPSDYIYWDDESPDHVTIKVSHESLIRGWRNFQDLVDAEAELFEEFASLLKAALRWRQAGYDKDLLLSGAPLRRAVQYLRLDRVLADTAASSALYRQLALKRDSERYRQDPALVMDFLKQSIAAAKAEAESEAEVARIKADDLARRARRSRNVAIGMFAGFVLMSTGALYMNRLRDQANASTAEALSEKARAEDERTRALQARGEAEADKISAQAWTYYAEYQKRIADSSAENAEKLARQEKRAKNEADKERKRTVSLQLTMGANDNLGRTTSRNPDLALLLAVQAVAASPTDEAKHALQLATQASSIQLTPTAGHTASLRGIDISRDGKRVVTAGDDNTAIVWDAETGRQSMRLSGHAGAIHAVAFSPDGKLVATGSYDDTARIWNSANGRESLRLSGHGDTVTSVAFDEYGKLLATGSEDRTARLWDVDTGRVVKTFNGHTTRVRGVAISRDGKRLATGSDDGSTKIWDAQAGVELLSLGGHTGAVRGVAFSPDGKHLVTAGEDKTARIWEVDTGRPGPVITGHGGALRAVAYSRDGKLIATGSFDDTARLWDAQTGKFVATFSGHGDTVSSLAFDLDGRRLATGSEDRTARLWEISTRQFEKTLGAQVGAPSAAAFSANGNVVATISGNIAILWNASTGREERRYGGIQKSPISSVAIDRQGERVVAGDNDGMVRIWGTQKGEKPDVPWKGHAGAIRAVAFSPDGTHVASGGNDGVVKVWNASTHREEASFSGHEGAVWSVAFGSVRNRLVLVTGGADRTARLWDVQSGEPYSIPVLRGHTGTVRGVAFNSSGTLVATASDDRTAREWEVETGRERYVLKNHTSAVRSVVFSPDGKLISTTSDDQTARIWGADTGAEQRVMRGHTSGVQAAVFPPESQRVLTVGADRTLRVHARDDKELLKLAQSQIRRSFTPEECEKYNVPGKSCEAARLAKQGKQFLDKGNYRDAIALYDRIWALDPGQISAEEWNTVCWQGSLMGYATAVVDRACEHAVERAKGLDFQHHFIDSRALARALNGRREGAIQDFQVYLGKAEEGASRNRRVQWVNDLKAGRNPFTPSVLATVRKVECDGCR